MTTSPYFDLLSDGLSTSSIMGVWDWIRPVPSTSVGKRLSASPSPLQKQHNTPNDVSRKELYSLNQNGPVSNGNGPKTPPQDPELPPSQTVLLLQAIRTPYTLTLDYPIPIPQNDDEVLIKTQVIGLNPIDWKAP